MVNIVPFTGSGELKILDVSNLSAPVELGDVLNVQVQDVRISENGNFVYLIGFNNPSSLQVLDISNPSSVLVEANLPLDASQATGLERRGTELYVSTVRGLYVFDISNPPTPLLTRSYATMSEIAGITVPSELLSQSENIYLSDRDGGIVALTEEDIQAPSIYITTPWSLPDYTNATPNINLGGVSDDNVGVTAITWSNDRGGGGNVNAPLDNWYVSGIALLPGTNILTVTAYDAKGNKASQTLTVLYTTTNQDQTITFPTIVDYTFGDSAIHLVAAASSGFPITFNVVSGPAAVTGNNILTFTGAGAVTVEASQLGGNGFNPATPVDVSFNVGRANQSIAFNPLPTHAASDAPFALTATTSSGLPVYFDIVSGPAVLDGNSVVTLLGGGTVAIAAWQTGNSNYNAAATVQNSFAVVKVPQTISFGPLSDQKAGDAPFAISATSDSGLPVSFSVSGPATLSGNIVTLTGPGTVSITASQPGNNTYSAAPDVSQSFSVQGITTNVVNTVQINSVAGGNLVLSMYGAPGGVYKVLVSSDLVNWTLLTTVTSDATGALQVQDAISNQSARFYRVLSQ